MALKLGSHKDLWACELLLTSVGSFQRSPGALCLRSHVLVQGSRLRHPMPLVKAWAADEAVEKLEKKMYG
ncbi:MAG: hypothetical protein B9J98_07675 [Candidatus Terraquivivens tikiterensis]|uniref:Uncharacterized protein n=1 Tax=Candidatus Terraquivivens tikiterensis TaxID=1980982 RepID=A0A2R7Y0U6_9ARCH|nr:MAG: hypothetical protein B9J98_07675 [Candidatus Terraquivivens tikiterensis]